MTRQIRAELFKLRTTSLWWWFGLATLVSTALTLIINCVQANSLLKPFDQYVALERHGRSVAQIPPSSSPACAANGCWATTPSRRPRRSTRPAS